MTRLPSGPVEVFAPLVGLVVILVGLDDIAVWFYNLLLSIAATEVQTITSIMANDGPTFFVGFVVGMIFTVVLVATDEKSQKEAVHE